MWYYIVAFFYRIAYWLVRFVFFFYYDIRFEGRENRPKESAAIFASNHRSYLDPVLVAMAAPHPFNYIAKESLFKTPVFGQFIRFMGAFPTSWEKDPSYENRWCLWALSLIPTICIFAAKSVCVWESPSIRRITV